MKMKNWSQEKMMYNYKVYNLYIDGHMNKVDKYNKVKEIK